MMILALGTAGASNYVVDRLAERNKWTDKSIVIWSLGLFVVLSLYCLIGFFTDSFGFKKGWEVFMLAFFCGIGLGTYRQSIKLKT